jgi:hypothetical protein
VLTYLAVVGNIPATYAYIGAVHHHASPDMSADGYFRAVRHAVYVPNGILLSNNPKKIEFILVVLSYWKPIPEENGLRSFLRSFKFLFISTWIRTA